MSTQVSHTNPAQSGSQTSASPQNSLDAIFAPRHVAVIGATERPGSVGRVVFSNLLGAPSLKKRVFPVSRNRATVLGIDAFPSVFDLPGSVDLAVIATPAETVPGVIEDCARAGVSGAIILSAGFREIGADGLAREQQIMRTARGSGMRILGPNCLGMMNPTLKLNATFAAGSVLPGNIAFLSPSGAICTAIMDWSHRELVGFSGFVSTGSMVDVGWGDLIDYFGRDPSTKSILIYMESVGDARSFMSAARQVAMTKPIVVIKPGRTETAAKAAISHTGALCGSDDVLDAAFSRAGVLRVRNLADLFYMAEVLSRQPRPEGPRLTVVTNAGGPGVLAADAVVESGAVLATLSDETLASLNGFLPPQWSHNNPVDVLGDAGPLRFAQTLEAVANDKNSDGVLAILTPQAMTDPLATAAMVAPLARKLTKPVIASWMGGASMDAAIEVLNRAGIPTFPYPDTAARVFSYMWKHTYDLRSLYETPATTGNDVAVESQKVQAILGQALADGRALLDEVESKQVLSSYGIPVVRTEMAADADAAVKIAEAIGYPVVLKVFSRTVTHKTEVDGIRLSLSNESAVRDAFASIRQSFLKRVKDAPFEGVTVQAMVREPEGYELIVGSHIDPQFGPVLLFGVGGQMVEVFRDRALALPPLNTTLAIRLMEQTKIFKALKGIRGRRAVDPERLANVLIAFSRLIIEQPRIKEIDINPLLASPDRILALDVRVVLHPAAIAAEQLPRPAIRPFPTQYVGNWTADNGQRVTIRPICADDEPRMVDFHKRLSEQSVHARYFSASKLAQRISHECLVQCCSSDYDKELSLIAEHTEEGSQRKQIVGLAQLSRLSNAVDAEFGIIVADLWQNHGLGSEMLSRLIAVAKAEGIKHISADVLADNLNMQRVCERHGFEMKAGALDDVVRAELVTS